MIGLGDKSSNESGDGSGYELGLETHNNENDLKEGSSKASGDRGEGSGNTSNYGSKETLSVSVTRTNGAIIVLSYEGNGPIEKVSTLLTGLFVVFSFFI